MLDSLGLVSLMSALGWAVVHFVWQGALIGVVAGVVLMSLRRGSAGVRYGVSCGAMLACVVVFVGTMVWIVRSGGSGSVVDLRGDMGAAIEMIERAGRGEGAMAVRDLPAALIAWVWAGGVALFAVRFMVQWLGAWRLRVTSVSGPGEHWRGVFVALRDEMGVGRGVRLLRSTLAEVPMVIGWLSPVVVVPVSAFTSLSEEQLRAVLAHELAHLRRKDHWVNAAQTVVETVLFFHPVVWWLSSRVRIERENCCDDAAVSSTGTPKIFAEALAQLESLRVSNSRVALAANGGSLMNRIARILGTRPPHIAPSTTWRTVTALTAGVLIAAAGIANAAAPELGQGDPVMRQILKDMVSSGGLSSEQARVLYDTMVFPGSEVEQKMEAELAQASERIKAAVESGRMSAEDGEKRLEGMRKRIDAAQERAFKSEILGLTKGEMHLENVKAELAAAVKSGRITAEQAEERYEATVKGVQERESKGDAMRERYEAAATELEAMVEAGKITQEQAAERLKGLRQRMASDRGDREDRKPNWEAIVERVKAAVANGDMTEEQARRMLEGIRERMAAGAKKDDRGGEGLWKRVAVALSEGGIEREDIRDVMGAMKRIVHEIREEGDEFELNERMLAYLTELGLDREQIGLVIRLSKRVAMAGERDGAEPDGADRGDGMWKRVAVALLEGGIEREDIRDVMGAMKRIVHEIREEGDAFELNERMLVYLTELGLDREQIGLVIRLSKRVAMAGDRRDGGVREGEREEGRKEAPARERSPSGG